MKTIIYQQSDLLLKQPQIMLQFSEKMHTAESEKCVEDIRALLHHALTEHLKKSEQLNKAAQLHESEQFHEADRLYKEDRI